MKRRKIAIILISLATLGILIAVVGWIFIRRIIQGAPQNLLPPHATPPAATSSPPNTQTISITGMKTYTNTEYGFEFQYPENWSFYAGTFYSPFSKFNLVGAPLGEDYQLDPPILVNIVTPDFADRAVISRKNLGAVESDVVVGDIRGVKYKYIEESPRISIDISLGELRMILGAKKQYEEVFDQILTTFKFLK